MKKMLFWALFAILLSCHPKQPVGGAGAEPETVLPDDTIHFTPPKNIILMIGDGMGITEISAGMYLNGNKSSLEQFEYIGIQKTYSNNNVVTDAAAATTAIACGKKTNNGYVGVDKRGRAMVNILEEARQKGYATGLITTTSLTHATPASFFAHRKSDAMTPQIASDLLKAELSFFVGGGKKDFDKRLDGQDLIGQLTAKGYSIATYLDKDFQFSNIDPTKNFGYFAADAEPSAKAQGRDYFLPACRAATAYLSKRQDKGFFLLINSAQIGKGGQMNDSDYITSEMMEFDKAIGAVLDFAMQDKETLVIVTANQETGGYAINPTSSMDTIVAAFTSDENTAALVPVFAKGPGEELFSGVFENTSIYDKMRRALGFKEVVVQ
jgi:alkaline phosphatase